MDLTSLPFSDVAGVVMTNGKGALLLQRRDNDPTISSPNMIGMFGGHKLEGENDHECAIREVQEETGHLLNRNQLQLIAKTRVQYSNDIIRMGTFYFTTNIDPASFEVTEGSLEIIEFREIKRYFQQMVPTTAYIISLLCEEARNGQPRPGLEASL